MEQTRELTPVGYHDSRALAISALYQSSTGDKMGSLITASRSQRTLDDYSSDWRIFREWSIEQGLEVPAVTDYQVPLQGSPVEPELVGLYVAELWGSLAPSTVRRRLSAIKYFHGRAGEASPTDHPGVRQVLDGYSREFAREPDRAAPLYLSELRAGLPVGDKLKAVRDRALLLVGFWGAFRRSELVAIEVGHVTDHPEGVVIKLPRSKTDQTGKGQRVALHYRDDEAICPVKALRAWLSASQIRTGPIFRGLNGPLADSGLSGRTVATVTKQAAKRAGLEPSGYSAHSLRSGFVSECSRRHVPTGAVRAVTRHQSEAMLSVYDRPGELFAGSAGAYFEGV